MKRCSHIAYDVYFEFNGTNQKEISEFTKNQILPSTKSDEMCLVTTNHVVPIKVGEYVIISTDGIRIVSKEQFEKFYTVIEDNLPKEENVSETVKP